MNETNGTNGAVVHDTQELYKKYRPREFSEMRGQSDAVAKLTDMVESGKIPHAVLFAGSKSGVGKTTAARILARHLDCVPSDVREINAADYNGIESVRQIRKVMTARGMRGGARVWILDECALLSTEAQNGLLKILEDPPPHAYFFLCTTHPDKLLLAVRTRCTPINLVPLSLRSLTALVNEVCESEGVDPGDEVVEAIAEAADGSGRAALVLLQQVIGLPPEDRLNAVQNAEENRDAVEIARALLNPRTDWKTMAALLKAVKGEPESIRHLVLAFMNTVLLGGGKNAHRAYLVCRVFQEPFHTWKGAALAASCYDVVCCSRGD